MSVLVTTGLRTRLVDLGDTTNCPQLGCCESCGSSWDNSTVTAVNRFGVYCLRVCERCLRFATPPDLHGRFTPAERVQFHREHLGISAAEMAEAIAWEARR